MRLSELREKYELRTHKKYLYYIDGTLIEEISEPINYNGAVALDKVKENPYNLQHVHNQTDEICFAAVKNGGYALQWVLNQTEEICIVAVRSWGEALQWVRVQTPAIVEAAVTYDDKGQGEPRYRPQDPWQHIQYVDRSIFDRKSVVVDNVFRSESCNQDDKRELKKVMKELLIDFFERDKE